MFKNFAVSFAKLSDEEVKIFKIKLRTLMESNKNKEAEKLVNEIEYLKPETDPILHFQLFDYYKTSKQYNKMIHLFQKVKKDPIMLKDERNCSEFYVMYGMMMDYYRKNMYDHLALDLFFEFEKIKKPNKFLISILIDIYSKNKKLNIKNAEKIIITYNYKNDSVILNQITLGYIVRGDFETALDLFERNSNKDITSYNIIINEYCRQKNLQKAKYLIEKAKEQGLELTIKTYHPLLQYYIEEDLPKEFSIIWNQLNQNDQKDLSGLLMKYMFYKNLDYKNFIHFFLELGATPNRNDIYKFLRENNIPPNQILNFSQSPHFVNEFIRELCQDYAPKDVLKVIYAFKKPDTLLMNILMSAYSKKNDLSGYPEFLEIMEKENIPMNRNIYFYLIFYYCKIGELEKAVQTYQRCPFDKKDFISILNHFFKGKEISLLEKLASV